MARTFTARIGDQLVRGAETPVAEMIGSFIVDRQLSPKSAREYVRYLEDFIAWAGQPALGDLTPDLGNRYVNHIKVRTVFGARFAAAVLKSFGSWLSKSQYISAPMGGSVLASMSVPKVPRDGRAPMDDDEVDQIIRVLASSPNRTRVRDTALFWLLFATGVRLNEARELRVQDVSIDLRKTSYIDVRGATSKSKMSRRIRLDPRAARAIESYLEEPLRPPFKGLGPETLFITASGKPFAYYGFQSYTGKLKDQFEAAGIVDWKPHRMRHTWATWYHRASPLTGTSLYDLQREGGWKDDSTPRRYTKDRPWEELAELATPISALMAKRRAS